MVLYGVGVHVLCRPVQFVIPIVIYCRECTCARQVTAGEVGPGAPFHNARLRLACTHFPTVDSIASEACERLRVLWPRLQPVLEGCLAAAPAARWTAAHALAVLAAPNARPFSLACTSTPARVMALEERTVCIAVPGCGTESCWQTILQTRVRVRFFVPFAAG